MQCLLVTQRGDRSVGRKITTCQTAELPAGDVLVEVMYSSLNYKDALGATGHAGVVSHFPHVPGIDAAGIVVNDASGRFAIGDRVIVTGFDLGAGRWGAYAEYIRVPADWVVPLPAGLSLRESMILGTAGFTAAMCLNIILHHGIEPDDGEVVVTGASGGVGTLAIALFAQSGFKVVAISGKPAARPLLQRLGAIEVLPRSAVLDDSNKSLLKPRWAAAVDTVGGLTLASMLRSAKPRGCVAACGLVGGADVPITVFPFILRGVTLAGVDSAWYPATRRVTIWSKLAGPWKPKLLEELAVEVRLDELDTKIEAILAGRVVGRIVVAIKTET